MSKLNRLSSGRNLALLRLFPNAAIVSPVAFSMIACFAPQAIAGSCLQAAPGGPWICSGAAGGGDVGQVMPAGPGPTVVTTEPDFGLDVIGLSYGFNILGQNGIEFTDSNNANIVAGGQFGISAYNTGAGDVVVSATGSISSTLAGGSGLYVYNDAGDTSLSVHDVSGEHDGIQNLYYGTGTLSITSTGTLTGTDGNGIYAYSGSGMGMTVEAVDTYGGNEGIYANNGGSGALTIISTGLAEGGNDRGILAVNSGGDLSVTALDTQGGSIGLQASNYGTGATLINSTGTAIGTGVSGISASSSNNSLGMVINANNAQGGTYGIYASHGSATGTPYNALNINVAGNVTGGSGFGIAAVANAGVDIDINLASDAQVEAVSGGAISSLGGDTTLTLEHGATVNGSVQFGDGDDTVNLNGGFSGITILNGGVGGRDTINLKDAAGAVRAVGDIQNWTVFNLDNSELMLTGGNISVGDAADLTTGIFLANGSTLDGSQDNFALTGNLSVAAGTRFFASGDGLGISSISGTLNNAGLITAAGGGAGDRLGIGGDYIGSNGLIILETELGDDTSLTDQLVIGGSTSGNSFVRIVNIGGAGAATLDGIEVISVGGVSDGMFILEGDYDIDNVSVVVAGLYAYQLVQGNQSGSELKNWYLQSALIDGGAPAYQAGVPVYEVYPQALLALNSLPTLQQRVGNRVWLNGEDENNAGIGIWTRIDGEHASIKPTNAAASEKVEQNIVRMQAGVDGSFYRDENGELFAGVYAQYGQGGFSVASPHGDGQIGTGGFGLGATATWYGHDGFYLDAQGQIAWYRSDLSSIAGNTQLVGGNNGLGYALSLEAGQAFALDEEWSLTPQAQLVFSEVDFDSFVDVYGTPVARDRATSLEGRLGLSVDYETTWRDETGSNNQLHAYGLAQVTYEFLNGTSAAVAGQRFDFEKDRLWGGLGLGASYSWDDGAYTLYGEGLVNTSLTNFGDSYALEGKLGLRVQW